jgi:ATP-binding cassette, subfamily B, bacterial
MAIAATAMIWYDWSLFLIVLGLAPGDLVYQSPFSSATERRAKKHARILQSRHRHARRIRRGHSSDSGVCSCSRRTLPSFGELAADHSRFNTRVLKTQGTFLPLLEMNSQIFMAVLLLVGGYRVLTPGAFD